MKKDTSKKTIDPCVNCPYKFGEVENSCTMTASYPNCTWWFYKKLALGVDPVEVQLEAKQCITRIKIFNHQNEGGGQNE